jgi:signal transduction histidine kinase
MIRTPLGSPPDAQQPDARLAQRIAETEQALALTRDFPRVRARIESGAASGTVWVPYGTEPWLVTIAPPTPPFPGLVLVVSSLKAAPPRVKLLSRTEAGDAMGDAFPGLRVEWSDNRFLETTRGGLPVAIWVVGLAMVLGIAVFCGYLILHDVNRDVRMTEVRSQFVASVSHELKTPLTSIRMFAETLSMGRANDRAKSEYLEIIVNESKRLARLKKIYRLRPTRLDEVAGSAVRAMQFPLAQQGFHLHVSVDEEMPELQADPMRSSRLF